MRACVCVRAPARVHVSACAWVSVCIRACVLWMCMRVKRCACDRLDPVITNNRAVGHETIMQTPIYFAAITYLDLLQASFHAVMFFACFVLP